MCHNKGEAMIEINKNTYFPEQINREENPRSTI
jgi:hypothetical protein